MLCYTHTMANYGFQIPSFMVKLLKDGVLIQKMVLFLEKMEVVFKKMVLLTFW